MQANQVDSVQFKYEWQLTICQH